MVHKKSVDASNKERPKYLFNESDMCAVNFFYLKEEMLNTLNIFHL